jgi:hypothetical protein
MRHSASTSIFGLRKLVLLGFCGLLLIAGAAEIPVRSQNAPPATDTPDVAAKKAAARKRFEELKQQLENNPDTAKPTETPAPGLLISPAHVGMLIHEEQRFTLLDGQGHNLKSQAEWSLSNSDVVDLASDSDPMITAKAVGTVILRAQTGGLSGEASVTVYPGDKLPDGTVRWSNPAIPGYKVSQVVQAVPGATRSSPPAVQSH